VALSDLCVLLVVINHGKSGRAKSEEFADFLNRVIGSNDPVFSRWAITTVWPQMADLSRSIPVNQSVSETLNLFLNMPDQVQSFYV
jgi:hypothetical protein